MKRVGFYVVLLLFGFTNLFSLDIFFNRDLPDKAGETRVTDSHYGDIDIVFIGERKIALTVDYYLDVLDLESNRSLNIAKAKQFEQFQNKFIILKSKNEYEGIFYTWDLSENTFLYDTKTGKQYRLNDPEDRAEILAAPEEVFRSFRYSYEGDNYEGFGRKEPFRIYRTDNYTLEKEVIWEAPVQEIFPCITFNAESHILDISEDGKNVLVSVGRGEKGSIFVADFDGTGLSNAREIMYDYVPDAVFVGNEYAVVPFDRMAVGTEGNGLWRLGIYDFEGNQVAVVEDVWVGDSINQFDVDEDGNQLVLVGIYKDEVGVYLFDIVR